MADKLKYELNFKQWFEYKGAGDDAAALKFGVDADDQLWFVVGDGDDAYLERGDKAYADYAKDKDLPPLEVLRHMAMDNAKDQLGAPTIGHTNLAIKSLLLLDEKTAKDAVIDHTLSELMKAHGYGEASVDPQDVNKQVQGLLDDVVDVQFKYDETNKRYDISVRVETGDNSRAVLSAKDKKGFEEELTTLDRAGESIRKTIPSYQEIVQKVVAAGKLDNFSEIGGADGLSHDQKDALQKLLSDNGVEEPAEAIEQDKAPEDKKHVVTGIKFSLDEKTFGLVAEFEILGIEGTYSATNEKEFNDAVEKLKISDADLAKLTKGRSYNEIWKAQLDPVYSGIQQELNDDPLLVADNDFISKTQAAIAAQKQMTHAKVDDSINAEIKTMSKDTPLSVWRYTDDNFSTFAARYNKSELDGLDVALIDGKVTAIFDGELIDKEGPIVIKGVEEYKKAVAAHPDQLGHFPPFDVLEAMVKAKALDGMPEQIKAERQMVLLKAVKSIEARGEDTRLSLITLDKIDEATKGATGFDNTNGKNVFPFGLLVKNVPGKDENGKDITVDERLTLRLVSPAGNYATLSEVQIWLGNDEGSGQWHSINSPDGKKAIADMKHAPSVDDIAKIADKVHERRLVNVAESVAGNTNLLKNASKEYGAAISVASGITDERRALFDAESAARKPEPRVVSRSSSTPSVNRVSADNGATSGASTTSSAPTASESASADVERKTRIERADTNLGKMAALAQSFMPPVFVRNDIEVLYGTDKEPKMLFQLKKADGDKGKTILHVMDLTDPDSQGWQTYDAFRTGLNTEDKKGWPEKGEDIKPNQRRVNNPLETIDRTKAAGFVKANAVGGDESKDAMVAELNDIKKTPAEISGVGRLMENASIFARNNMDLVVAGGAALLGAIVKPFQMVAGAVGVTAIADRLRYAFTGTKPGDGAQGKEDKDTATYRSVVQRIFDKEYTISPDAAALLENLSAMRGGQEGVVAA